ncbi:Hsp20/alpha crystallin family protein [Aneurinibacillus terranovensis]|uniref:Hsp20/alpha crystallin family protein n=1 Tax=Aneurinibacillus terranovensis TaxID=278991 RepID=UPI0004212D41|nr:Hsp20/alpha crystallin family protein [Aneurinibacillus terranovensis]
MFDNLDSLVVKIDVQESEVLIAAKLPGFKREEIEVEILDKALRIAAKRRVEVEKKTEIHYHLERDEKYMERIIPYPTDVKEQDMKAAYKDGILTIQIPKRKAGEVKRPEVKRHVRRFVTVE